MKTNYKRLLIGILMLAGMPVLFGCADQLVTMPTATVDSMTGAIVDTGQVVGTASMAKENAWRNAQMNRDVQRRLSHANDGFHVAFAMQEVSPGVFVQVMTQVSYADNVDFGAPIHDPSRHPVWKTIDNIVDKGAKYGFSGYAAHEVGGVLKAGYEAATGAGDTINMVANGEGNVTLDQKRSTTTTTIAGNENTVTNTSNPDTAAAPAAEEEAPEGGECLTEAPAGCPGAECSDGEWWSDVPGLSCDSYLEETPADPPVEDE
jgi:hypothetical protein